MDKEILIKQFKLELSGSGYAGDFHIDYSTRLVNATDNSIYEVMPLAVAQPKSIDDLYTLVKIANLEKFSSFCLTARGGGTGTNGQSLTNSIVVDLSRHMNKIIEFTPEEQTITVEPGVILADLNRFLQPHGLFFAPDVSTANRATIGGMIATDAAGKGSLIYGKTIDSLISLKVILADGYVIDTDVTPISSAPSNLVINPYTSLDAKSDHRLNGIHQNLINWLSPVQDEIDKRFLPLKRPLSGYNIKRCYQNGKINLTPLFAGSEGTLGIVAQAKLKLLPIPKYKTLVVVHYASFLDALKDSRNLIKFKPLAIEAVDEKVQKSAQTLPNWPIFAKWLNSEGKNYISNFIEFVANDKQELENTISNLEAELKSHNANYVVIRDEKQIAGLWSIRSLAVGLAGKMPGQGKPVAFIEDAIVPPENLANFVADLQQMLEKENLQYAMYGHVDVGCIHVRPALNMQQEDDREKIRPITEHVIRLLNKHNGILWGEHGKGFRGEFVPDVFGPVLYPILCKIKHLFDPHNRLNPGKLAAPQPDIKLDRIELIPMRGQFDQVISQTKQKDFVGSMLCNGNAACFNQEPGNVMCPSYKVTKDRVHSPKGRAMLVKQWLRETEKLNLGNQPARSVAQVDSRIRGNDKSWKARSVADMALNALNGCLGCKGCTGKCPTQVSIPDLKTKFLDSYHSQYKRRSFRDLALGNIESLLPIFAKFPKTWNFLNRLKLLPTFGLVNIPLFKLTQPLTKLLEAHRIEIYKNPEQIKVMTNSVVVIFADVFTGFLDTDVLIAAISLLKKMGYTPYVIYPRSSGKSLIAGGFISKFKSNTDKLANLFNPLFTANIPIIGLENTITHMFRDEVKKFANSFAGHIQTLAEFLNQNIDKLPVIHNNDNETGISETRQNYKLLPHCTEQAVLPGEAILWQGIFNHVGIKLEVQNAGCCGMAGAYGYQKEHQANSKNLFAMHWQQPLSNSNVEILATGFSCRCQAQKQANKLILHPIHVLL
ncbi:MAG: glycerol-3-phosphate dehydrogenase [Burkholderiales bacterium]|jgi:FAD/FMN-containing dehydrogenase/Fe-S oxidoreductase|nr:glycerol-3-phosphate dehydrogenase [Burkholderiales bacterium]